MEIGGILNYYVYVLLNTLNPGKFSFGEFCFDYEPFYVGMGNKRRAKLHFTKTELDRKHNVEKNDLILKIINETGDYPLIEYMHERISQEEASLEEKKFIKLIGRKDFNEGPLLNKTDGGEGFHRLNESSKRKIGDSRRGDKHPLYGKALTKETKRRISKSLSGEKHPNFGVSWSKEVKNNMSNGAKNRVYTKEGLKKLSQAKMGDRNPFYGKHHSEETKAILREKCPRKQHSEKEKAKRQKSMAFLYQDEEHLKKLSNGQFSRSCNDIRTTLTTLLRKELSLTESNYNENRVWKQAPKYKKVVEKYYSEEKLQEIYDKIMI